MSKFLDRLERISRGTSASMGFGVPRAEKLPGLALVGLVAGDDSAGLERIAGMGPDAVLLSGLGDPDALAKLGQSLASVPWGARLPSLNEEQARALREAGCDLLAFSLTGTSVAAVTSEEMARILCVAASIEERELRAVESLPIDALLLSMTEVGGAWMLQDLATVGSVGRRVRKYVLVEVSQPPGQGDLEALRNAGVHGLVLDIGAVPAEALAQLKTALLAMPRRQSSRRDRAAALLPAPVISSAQGPEPEEPEEEDE